jgi:hypothetical protein
LKFENVNFKNGILFENTDLDSDDADVSFKSSTFEKEFVFGAHYCGANLISKILLVSGKLISARQGFLVVKGMIIGLIFLAPLSMTG